MRLENNGEVTVGKMVADGFYCFSNFRWVVGVVVNVGLAGFVNVDLESTVDTRERLEARFDGVG